MPRSPLGKPLIVTQGFRANKDKYGPQGHTGIDLRSRLDDPWFSCVPGFVHFKGTWPYLTGYGAYIELDWGQNDGSYIKFIYGHGKNRRKELDNKHVAEGQKLAVSGNTGWSTAAHLHFEMRHYRPGKAGYTLLNPIEFLEKYKIPYTTV